MGLICSIFRFFGLGFVGDVADSIDYVIDSYLLTDNVDDRAQFVMEPKRIKPLMQKWYNGVVPTEERNKTFGVS